MGVRAFITRSRNELLSALQKLTAVRFSQELPSAPASVKALRFAPPAHAARTERAASIFPTITTAVLDEAATENQIRRHKSQRGGVRRVRGACAACKAEAVELGCEALLSAPETNPAL
jgi:hypothetical protein